MRCSICRKYVWFWQPADYLEVYGDAKAFCHNNCFEKKKRGKKLR